MESVEMGLESVGELGMHMILSKLGPTDAASVECVNKRFRTWVSQDELLWSKYCSDDLELDTPLDPRGYLALSFKEAYQKWREAFDMYPWSLVTRIKRCWSKLKNWLATNFPEVLATLRTGASEDEIKYLETSLKVKLPLPTRVLYRFYDGQELTMDSFSQSMPRNLVGLIGGYSFCGHSVNVSLLPLHQVISHTIAFIRLSGFRGRSRYIIVANSTFKKIFFLNCVTGQLYVGKRDLVSDSEMFPCVPDSLIKSVHDSKCDQLQDAMLLWLEEHGRRLECGTVKVRQEGEKRGINLFPELPPVCQIAVTHGIKVRASAVFVPELSNLQDESQKFLFAYSIRMSLLPEGCTIGGTNFSSCQLSRRHWVICIDDAVVNNVDGKGVMGKFPLLHPGEEEFIYESCIFLSSSPGSIEGYFSFVPGRLGDPKGSPIAVEVAKFPLSLPEYIF